MPVGPMKPLIDKFNVFNGINWQFWFGCSPIQPLSPLPRVPLCLAPQMLSLEPDLGDAQQPELCQEEGGQLCGGSHFKEKWPNYYHWYKGCNSPAAPTARHLEPCRLCMCQTHVFLPVAHKKLGSRGLELRRVFMCVKRCKKSLLWPRCARVREGWALGWLQELWWPPHTSWCMGSLTPWEKRCTKSSLCEQGLQPEIGPSQPQPVVFRAWIILFKNKQTDVTWYLLCSQLHLFSQKVIKRQMLHLYTPRAEIPKIKTRRNLKFLHFKCKIHFILSFMQVFHARNRDDLFIWCQFLPVTAFVHILLMPPFQAICVKIKTSSTLYLKNSTEALP